MDGSITITLPRITDARLTPLTVNTGQQYLVSVTVEEITVILEPVYPYSGQIYSGQWGGT